MMRRGRHTPRYKPCIRCKETFPFYNKSTKICEKCYNTSREKLYAKRRKYPSPKPMDGLMRYPKHKRNKELK